MTGNREIIADPMTIRTDLKENASPVVVSSYNSTPALMKPKEGGATPIKVPMKKGVKGTLRTGDEILMNQFGRNGVILKKVI